MSSMYDQRQRIHDAFAQMREQWAEAAARMRALAEQIRRSRLPVPYKRNARKYGR